MNEQTLENTLTADDFLKEEDRDLGFGAVVSGQSRQRLLNPDGSFNVQRTGLPLFTSLNLYHSLLTMKWRTFLLLVLLLYFLTNIVFGLAYTATGTGALVDTSSTPMANAFLTEQQLVKDDTIIETPIDIFTLPAGLYMMRVEGQSNTVIQRFVKN